MIVVRALARLVIVVVLPVEYAAQLVAWLARAVMLHATAISVPECPEPPPNPPPPIGDVLVVLLDVLLAPLW